MRNYTRRAGDSGGVAAPQSGSRSDLAGVLGTGLRELRCRAGLSLVELAHLMGREPGFYSYLSRLERGRVKLPSLALVVDYLRACRASFADILPLLDGYTNQPPVRESRARETALSGLAGGHSRDASRLNVYDRKTEAARRQAGQKPVTPAKRASALSRQLAAVQNYRALSRVVENEVNRLRINPTLVVRKAALDYGRMVWKALELTEAGKPKSSRGRPRKTRKERLSDAEARFRALAGDTLPRRAIRQLRDRVMRLYEETHREGGR